VSDIPLGPWRKPLIDLQVQPADCGPYCPCNVGPSDGSEYGWRYEPNHTGEVLWAWLSPKRIFSAA
jgi:hypothetical protein